MHNKNSLRSEHNITTSVKGFIWEMREKNERLALAFQQKLNVPEIIANIICTKCNTIEEAELYLTPTIRDYLPDPMHLLDMKIAANRLAEAVINKQKIAIFGDYDVDGATSSSLLKIFFKSLGLDSEIYIPDRMKEGYGPTIEAFEKLHKKQTEVIITVDCGTLAIEPVNFANSLGIDVIIVDHHLSEETLPDALAIVNPNRFDENSEYKYLAAVAVAFLLSVAVNSVLRSKGFFQDKQEPNLLQLLDLVALGTICDMVPLEGLNRAFVVQGLKILAKRTNIGLSVLADISGIDEFPNIYHLGYLLGPRINAGGRVGESYLGSKLLSSVDYEESYIIAKSLDKYNNERKEIEANLIEAATMQASKQDSNLLFIVGKNWHQGVVGIIASRLKEKFNKPAVVISLDDNCIGKASCRSIKGINFGANIANAIKLGLIISGGGHAMAAGFLARESDLEDLKKFLEDSFCKELSESNLTNHKYYEICLTPDAITLELAKLLEKIGPYGSGNPEPRFLIPKIYIAKIDLLRNAHISCLIGNDQIHSGGALLKAVAFNIANTELGDSLLRSKGKKISIIGYIRINRWNGKERAEFMIDDVII